MSKSSSKLSTVAKSISAAAALASLVAFNAVTPGSASAQSKAGQPSPTLQRLEGLQKVEQDRQSAEDAKWRSFSRIDPPARATSVGTPRPVETVAPWFFDALTGGGQPQHLHQKCAFYWPGWKLRPDGTRVTAVRGCLREWVAVDCKSLKVSWHDRLLLLDRSKYPAGWSTWSVPQDGETTQMVAELCDNITASGIEETGSKTFASYIPAQSTEVDYRETIVQSPQGWRLVGINSKSTIWWIKPSTVKGAATDRTVLKLSFDPDRPTKLSESRVHINCITAQQQQSNPLGSQVRTPPLVINQGSTWESIAKIICPPGTYASGASARPLAPLR